MSVAATFLGGAKSRLLPASIPFRFFATAVVFHVLMWFGPLVAPNDAVGFRGGPGPVLASLHALTLGVLVTTAIGASVQLLPVATRRPLAAVWPTRLVFWLLAPGLIALFASMFTGRVDLLGPAAALSAIGLLLYAGLLADNLRRAQSVPIAAAYGWAALAAFGLVIVVGVVLAVDDRLGMLVHHDHLALAHLILGGFGFMGLLALGFSHILVPMFALATAPPARTSLFALALAVFAIAAGTTGALADSPAALTAAALVGLAAASLHVQLMLKTLQDGMRKRLGLSFTLVRAAWLMLLLTPIIGLAAVHGWAGPNGPTLFAFVLFGGWLLTFLLGILQRILPFLASMHAARPGAGAVPLMSDLAGSAPLRLHAICHGFAVAIVTAAIAADRAWLMQVGCLIGLLGALSFAWFSVGIIRRIPWTQPALATVDKG